MLESHAVLTLPLFTFPVFGGLTSHECFPTALLGVDASALKQNPVVLPITFCDLGIVQGFPAG